MTSIGHAKRGFLFIASLALLAMPVVAGNGIEPIHHPGGLTFDTDGDFERAVLSVSGPEGIHFTEEFASGQSPAVGLDDGWGNNLPDGQYTWELTTEPRVSQELRSEMSEARAAGDEGWVAELANRLPRGTNTSGTFRVTGGAIVSPDRPEPATRAASPGDQGPISNTAEGVVGVSQGDQVILDDLIVDGSICAGFDCVNGESFGFDTIRMKENNLRLKAQDTSTSASFPTQDWQLTFNDTTNGGQNKFSIDALSPSSGTPFTIEAGAPSNSLYVDDGGRLGFGTSTPVADLHVKSGNTPTLRLEQDGSSGFTAQTWDVAGNEANFFIRDATNGSTLPIRLRPGAPSSAIDIAASGNIGLNDSSPEAPLTIVRNTGDFTADGMVKILSASSTGAGSAVLRIEDSGGTGTLDMLEMVNNGQIGIDAFADTQQWRMVFGTQTMTIRDQTGTTDVFSLRRNNVGANAGDLTIFGDIFTQTCSPCISDYVFEPDYELMPLDELADFVAENKHLPNVPGKADLPKEGGSFGIQKMQVKLLEKIEELTLYTLAQQETIQAMRAELDELHALRTTADQ